MLFFDLLTSTGMLIGGISMKQPSTNAIEGKFSTLGMDLFLGSLTDFFPETCLRFGIVCERR